jgi:hypothetical protein
MILSRPRLQNRVYETTVGVGRTSFTDDPIPPAGLGWGLVGSCAVFANGDEKLYWFWRRSAYARVLLFLLKFLLRLSGITP